MAETSKTEHEHTDTDVRQEPKQGLFSRFVSWLGRLFGYTACTVGTCGGWRILALQFAPFGNQPDDFDEAKSHLRWLGNLGIAVSIGTPLLWYFGTGGIAAIGFPAVMQRLAMSKALPLTRVVDAIEEANIKKMGLAVWVVAQRTCCVKGIFGTYWKECAPDVIPVLPLSSAFSQMAVAGKGGFIPGLWHDPGFLKSEAARSVAAALSAANPPCR